MVGTETLVLSGPLEREAPPGHLGMAGPESRERREALEDQAHQELPGKQESKGSQVKE